MKMTRVEPSIFVARIEQPIGLVIKDHREMSSRQANKGKAERKTTRKCSIGSRRARRVAQSSARRDDARVACCTSGPPTHAAGRTVKSIYRRPVSMSARSLRFQDGRSRDGAGQVVELTKIAASSVAHDTGWLSIFLKSRLSRGVGSNIVSGFICRRRYT